MAGVQRPGARPPVKAPPNVSKGQNVDIGDEGSLFDRYSAARRKVGEQGALDRLAFERQIERQRQQIEKKIGRKVKFEVVVDGEKVKLAARAAKTGATRER